MSDGRLGALVFVSGHAYVCSQEQAIGRLCWWNVWLARVWRDMDGSHPEDLVIDASVSSVSRVEPREGGLWTLYATTMGTGAVSELLPAHVSGCGAQRVRRAEESKHSIEFRA
jgi:hypothetical protein